MLARCAVRGVRLQPATLPVVLGALRAPAARMIHTEKKIEELGFTLPPPAKPLATYVPWVRTGNQIFISGHIPFKEDMKRRVEKIKAAEKTLQNLKNS